MRLLRGIVFVAALVLLGVVLGAVIGAPLVEERVAREIGAELGGEVDYATVPVVTGRLGDVTVRSRGPLVRDDIVLSRVTARLDDVRLTGAAFRGRAEARFARIDVVVRLDEAAVTDVVRRRLAAAGIAGLDGLVVRIGRGRAVAQQGSQQVPMTVEVAGPRSIRIVPGGSGPVVDALRAALAAPVDVGPLPYRVELLRLRLMPGRAVVTARRGPGTTEEFD